MSVGEIAAQYPLSLAGVAKHLDVLHRARLITKSRNGKEQIVSLAPESLAAASKYLDTYEELWTKRLDSLGAFLETITPQQRKK